MGHIHFSGIATHVSQSTSIQFAVCLHKAADLHSLTSAFQTISAQAYRVHYSYLTISVIHNLIMKQDLVVCQLQICSDLSIIC